MRHILIAISAVTIVFVSFMLGRLSLAHDTSANIITTKEDASEASNSSTTTQIYRGELPNNSWIHYKGQLEDAGAVGIFRTDDLKKVIAIGVYNPNFSNLYAEFYPENGHIKEVTLMNSRSYVRELTFRKDGILESETIYQKDGRNGTKILYKEDGSKESEQKVKMNIGS